MEPLPGTLWEQLIKFQEKISAVVMKAREVCDWLKDPVAVVVTWVCLSPRLHLSSQFLWLLSENHAIITLPVCWVLAEGKRLSCCWAHACLMTDRSGTLKAEANKWRTDISSVSPVADRYPAPSHCVAAAEISFPGVPRSNLMNGNLVTQALLHWSLLHVQFLFLESLQPDIAV